MKKPVAILIENKEEFKIVWEYYDKNMAIKSPSYPEIHTEYPCLIEKCTSNVRWVEISKIDLYNAITYSQLIEIAINFNTIP